MKFKFCVLLGAAITIAACAPQAPEQQIIADAADALGGRDKVLAVNTITIEGEGTNGNLGQDMTMDAAQPTVNGERAIGR